MRTLRNLTGFLFGMVIAMCLALAMLPRAHAAAPPHIRGVLAMIIGIDESGNVVGAKLIGLPTTMAECGEITKQAQATLPQMTPPKGVTLITACVALQADNSTTT